MLRWLHWRKGRPARLRARQVLRGYDQLQDSADPELIARLNEHITRLPLGNRSYSSLIFEETPAEVELAARQFLILSCAGLQLNGAILRTISDQRERVSARVPPVWVRAMREAGISVAVGRCRILFAGFVAKRFLIGIAQIARVLLARGSSTVAMRGAPYVQFEDIVPSNLPRKAGGPSYDVVSWYLAWEGRPTPIAEVWQHSVPLPEPRWVGGTTVKAVGHVIPPLNVRAKLSFAAWGAVAGMAAVWALVRGRWLESVLLSHAAWAKQMALIPDDLVAREYLFSLSSAMYRPLWTYAAERRGARVTLVNYAASLQDFKSARQLPHAEIGFESMTWPRMLVWTDSYADYARARLPHVRVVERVPPVWFSDSDDELPHSPRPCVAVFDVTPSRPTRMALAVPALPYRTFDIGRDFLEHIYEVLQSAGYDLLWKRKRSFGPAHDKRYIRFSKQFAARPGVVDVPPNISAFRVVRASVAVISTPFTSTAFIASSMDRASVFYDPTQWLYGDDPAAQGLPLASTRGELAEWLKLSRAPAAAARSAAT